MTDDALFLPGKTVHLWAALVAERIDLRGLERLGERLVSFPLTLKLGEHRWLVAFRYGAVVLFNVPLADRPPLLERIREHASRPFANPETEELEITVGDGEEQSLVEGGFRMKTLDLHRSQVFAEILARTTVLAHYESMLSSIFDAIEPFAANLDRVSAGRASAGALIRHLGQTLLIRQAMLGRVEVDEKPELVWDRPELERLFLRLMEEYELRERHRALRHKVELIAQTASTALQLIQEKRMLRVEWYIVLLIVVEVVIIVYEFIAA